MKHLTITMPEVPSLTSDDEHKIISFFNKEIKRLKKDKIIIEARAESSHQQKDR